MKINQRTQGSDNKTKKEHKWMNIANYELKFVWLLNDFQIVMYSQFDAKRLRLSIMRKGEM